MFKNCNLDLSVGTKSSAFHLNANHIYYQDLSEESPNIKKYAYEEHSMLWSKEPEKQIESIVLYNDILIVRDSTTAIGWFLSASSGKEIQLPEFYNYRLSHGFDVQLNKLVVTQSAEPVAYTGVYDLEDQKLLFLQPGIGRGFLFPHFLIGLKNDRTVISKNDLESGKEEWSFDLGDLFKEELAQKTGGRAKQILGVYQNLLLVYVEPYWIVGIDLESGLSKLKFSFYSDILSGAYKPFLFKLHFLSEENKIIGLFAGMNFELDLESEKFKLLKDYREGIRFTEWDFVYSHVSQSKIYFAARKNWMGKLNHIGVFDRDQLDVVWSRELDLPFKSYIKNMKVFDGERLFFCSKEGKLFLFEKDA